MQDWTGHRGLQQEGGWPRWPKEGGRRGLERDTDLLFSHQQMPRECAKNYYLILVFSFSAVAAVHFTAGDSPLENDPHSRKYSSDAQVEHTGDRT